MIQSITFCFEIGIDGTHGAAVTERGRVRAGETG